MAGLQLLDPYPRGTLGEHIGRGLEQAGDVLVKNMKQKRLAQDMFSFFESQGKTPAEAQRMAQAFVQLDPNVQAQYMRGAQAADYQNQQLRQQDQARSFVENIKGGVLQDLGPVRQQFQPTERNAEGYEYTPVNLKNQRQMNVAQQKPMTQEARLQTENERLLAALDNPNITPAQKSLIRESIENNQQRIDKIESQREKKYGKDIADLRSKAHAAKDDLQALKRLQELEDEGLITPGYHEFLSRSGLDLPALMNPASEEFQKVTQNFMRKAKEYLGARISNYELEQFLKTIPSLSQSPEGRKRVISQMKNIAHAQQATYKEAQNIIKENKGIAPRDLFEQVDKRMKSNREKFAAKFKKDLARKVPEAQNSLATVAQAAAGSAVKPLGGAALGAAIGSFLGPVGTAVGGGLGALGGLGLDYLLRR